MSRDFVFFLALSLLLTHEMDAIRCREWRIFPFTARLNDRAGYLAFTAAHVPLYVLLLWALGPADAAVRAGFIIGLDLFCIVHLGLHLAFRRHPAHAFRDRLSWALIAGAGLCGALDLALRSLTAL